LSDTLTNGPGPPGIWAQGTALAIRWADRPAPLLDRPRGANILPHSLAGNVLGGAT